jgi:hypothetical protein
MDPRAGDVQPSQRRAATAQLGRRAEYELLVELAAAGGEITVAASISKARCGHSVRMSSRHAVPADGAHDASDAAVAPTSRYSAISPPPSSSTCTIGTDGFTQSTSSSSARMAGDAAASGKNPEQVSCTNPGSVSGAERTALPGADAPSSTTTSCPGPATCAAATRP